MRRRLTILVLFLACLPFPAFWASSAAALPTDPQVITSIELPYGANDMALSGEIAYLTTAEGALRTFDVSSPASPAALGFCAVWGTNAIALAGHYAYIVSWIGLSVVDVSDPSLPVQVGMCSLPDGAREVAVAGDYAYVVGSFAHATPGYGGLQVVDISKPAAPAVIGSCVLPSTAFGVALAGTHAYVADFDGGLQVVDITVPAAPFVAGSCSLFSSSDLVLAGHYAFVADGPAGLRVVDVTSPSNPTLVATMAPAVPGQAFQGIAAAGDRAYLTGYLVDGFEVVDVTNPLTPVVTGACSAGGKVVPSGDLAYVAGSRLSVVDLDPAQLTSLTPNHGKVGATVVISGVDLEGGGAVHFGNVRATTSSWSDTSITCTVPDGLTVGDLSLRVTPTDGVTSNRLTFTVEGPHLVSLTPDHAAPGGTVIIAGSGLGSGGAVKFGGMSATTSAWSDTSITCTIPLALTAGVTAVSVAPTGQALSNRLAFKVDGGAVPPTGDPRLVASCPLLGLAIDVAVDDGFAYVAGFNGGLQVVDISIPEAPVIVGSCRLAGNARAVAVSGTLVYVIVTKPDVYTGLDGLQVVDVSIPTEPVVVGSCQGPIDEIAVAGAYAYCTGGLSIIDLTTPAAPALVGYCTGIDGGWDVSVAGGYAYVTWGGLYVVDVHDAAAPTIVGSCTWQPGGADGVAVAGGFAYVGAGPSGLKVVDVRTPSAPVVIGSLPGFYAAGVAAAGDFAYVAGSVISEDESVDGSLLNVVDVGSPSAPALVGSCSLPGTTQRVAVQGHYAYLANHGGSLQVLDLGHRADARSARLTCSVKPASVGYKGLVTIKGELRDALGGALLDRTVVLQQSSDGTHWSDLKSLASETGVFSTTVSIVRKTYFRWRYEGDDTYAGAVSATYSAISRASLTALSVPSTVRHGVKYTVAGYLRPQHTDGKAPVTITFFRSAGGRWHKIMSASGSRWKNVSGATKYGCWFTIAPQGAGKWRVQAMHKDADHAASYSPWRYFTVK